MKTYVANGIDHHGQGMCFKFDAHDARHARQIAYDRGMVRIAYVLPLAKAGAR